MGGNNSNGNCFAAELIGDKIVLSKAPETFNAIDTVSFSTYSERHERALAKEEKWTNGEVTPDARQMIEPPEAYDTVFSTGERYAHAKALGAGLLRLENLPEGEPFIAYEYMDGANPYAQPTES